MRDSVERFCGRVQNYVRYRPGYPEDVLDLLRNRCGLADTSAVADIGSGPGVLSKLLLRTGCRVFGVEPNREMREAAESLLSDQPFFVSVEGTAEDTTLQDESVDLITAAQAFHWFDRARAGVEFRRIARPDTWLVILWNTRLTQETPFLAAYEELLKRHSGEYAQVDHRSVTHEAVVRFFAPASVESAAFPNRQQFDFAGLSGRLMSSSYSPARGEPAYDPMMEELRRIFDGYQNNGIVEFLYRTEVHFGKLGK
jgi:SAM-dependent methyltransferase